MLKGISKDVFAETWIVVPNHTAKQWLQKSLAKDLGVCAQIKFIMPLSFNWEIIKNVATQEHKINIFTTDVLRWQIYGLLNDDEKYQHIKQDTDLKNFNLSEKIAQTLLKYNEEHPEIITKWDNDVYEVSENNNWQIEMWLQLQENLSTKSPVELLELFDAEKDFTQTPEHIIMFATEQLTSLQKATLLKLSINQDIEVFLTNASPDEYWFDLKPEATKARNKIFKTDDIIDVGNPLLSNLGYNKMAIFDAFLQEDIYLKESDSHKTSMPSSLLQSLKHDIYTLSEHPIKCLVDESIKVHSCHNRMREVEIIKDEILASLDKDKSLNPEQIVVVAPDINEYVSHIKNVFGDNSQCLPYHIDRVQLVDNQYIIALMKLMQSFTYEMTSVVIYELLSQSTIIKKLNISDNDLPRLKHWMLNSNIRNFYSSKHKAQLGYEKLTGNTWEFGRNRWMSGYLADESDTKYLSTYGDIAGQEDLFIQAFGFLDLWYKYYEKSQKNQTPQQWHEFIKGLCQDFLYNDLQDDYEKRIIDQLKNKLISQTLESKQRLPLVIINTIVETVITENNYRSEGQIGIRFQTWENAFIADAKLVIIMGLNDNEFPKKQIKNDLDIFSKTPSRLNKSTRARDKNLMLTALTENTDKLIMTYIGFNAKTNDEQSPSVILAEIISYLQQKTQNEFSVISHKMHGYNAQYFKENTNSYNQQQYELAKNFYNKNTEQKDQSITIGLEVEKDIRLNELIKFFTDPLDYFLKNRANIQHQIYEDNLQETESYSIVGLDAWKLRQEIFINDKSTAAKTGIVTDSKSGMPILNKYADELNSIKELVKQLALKSHIIDIKIDDYKIFGSIEINEQQQLVSIYPNKLNSKSLCQHWIKHLCYSNGQSSVAYFLDKTIEYSPVENNDEILKQILHKWQTSFTQPWLFSPKAMINPKKLSQQTSDNYRKSFIASNYSFPSDGEQYFREKIYQYENSEDISIFIDTMLNCLEFKQ